MSFDVPRIASVTIPPLMIGRKVLELDNFCHFACHNLFIVERSSQAVTPAAYIRSTRLRSESGVVTTTNSDRSRSAVATGRRRCRRDLNLKSEGPQIQIAAASRWQPVGVVAVAI